MDQNITLRELSSVADLRACVALQVEIWGHDMQGNVPPLMLKVIGEAGGLVAGAFDSAGSMLGFVCGLAGNRHGRPVHWSHMLGVSREARDLGLGRQLKDYQRDRVLAQGIDSMYWSFDPLEARNAHLNFNRLGVELDEYRQDFYKGLSDSPRLAGIGTDRLVVVWKLRDENVELARERALPGSERIESYLAAPVVNPGDGAAEWAEAEHVRVEIPARIQRVRTEEPEEAMAWRQSTRAAFQRYLQAGYTVETFFRSPSDGRCFYGLRAGESHQENG